MREAGRGSLWISLRRSLPNATLTERLHRSIRERGSAGGRQEGASGEEQHVLCDSNGRISFQECVNVKPYFKSERHCVLFFMSIKWTNTSMK